MKNLSNAEKALRYLHKSRLLGAPALNIDILEDDRVILRSVEDGEGTLVIPKFITEVCGVPMDSPFGGTHYSTIIFEGSYDSFERAFENIQSTSLKIVHPGGRLKNLKQAFQDCRNLEYLDLRDCNLSNVEITDWAFLSCQTLRKLDLGSGFQRITDATLMFFDCGLRKIRLGDWFDPSLYAKRTGWRMFPYTQLDEIDISSIPPSSNANVHNLFEHILMGCEAKTLIIRCIDRDISKTKIEEAYIERLVIKEESPKQLVSKFIGNFKHSKVKEVINGLQD